MVGGAILLTMSAATAAVLPTVRLSDAHIRFRDVAGIGTRGDRVILTMPRSRRMLVLSPGERRALVAHRLPGARFTLAHPGAVRFVAPAPSRATGARGSPCLAARWALPAGAALTADDVAPIACAADAGRAPLGYDAAARTVVARAPLAAGTYLGRVKVAADAPLLRGQPLVFRTRAGPVTIERPVIALQSARPGARAFVRTEDGVVVTARVARAAPLAAREGR